MPTDSASRQRRVLALAWTAPLRQYLAGRLVSTLSSWVFRVTAGWAVWEMTRSPAMLGVALFLQLMPQVLLAPWAGVLADRYDKRLVLAASHVASAALKLMVAALALAGALTVPVLMGLLVVVGCANALQQAAAKTIVSALVEEDDLVTAISLNSVIFNLAGFVGPAVAGIAIAYGGVAAGFGAAAVAALLFLFTLRALPSAPAHADSASSFGAQMVAGARYTLSEPLIKRLLALHLASATLARPFLEFVPALVSTLFSGGASQVATVTSASGLGAVAGGLWLAQRDARRGMLPVVLGAMLSLGITLIAFAWNPWYPLAVALAFAAGFGMITRAAAMQTMIQAAAAPAMRGRAVSFYGLVLHMGAITGALVIGFLSELLGLSWALTLSVSAALLAWALMRAPLARAASVHPSTQGVRRNAA